MEGNRFDIFTRRLSATNTRRGAVRTLAATGLGLGLLQAQDGAARRRTTRCRKLLDYCKPTSKVGCCPGLLCRDQGSAYQCCKGIGATCGGNDECCGLLICGAQGTCRVPPISLP